MDTCIGSSCSWRSALADGTASRRQRQVKGKRGEPIALVPWLTHGWELESVKWVLLPSTEQAEHGSPDIDTRPNKPRLQLSLVLLFSSAPFSRSVTLHPLTSSVRSFFPSPSLLWSARGLRCLMQRKGQVTNFREARAMKWAKLLVAVIQGKASHL